MTEYELIAALRANGHILQTCATTYGYGPKGDVDFVFTGQYDEHDGPRCVRCGQTWCEYCTEPEHITACKESA